MTAKILLLDDSKTQLNVLKINLVKCGFEVETAENAYDGYKKISSFIPDVIVSDIVMPNLDGYQFCRLLKNNEITKNIPVVLLTVLSGNKDRFWAKNAGAQAFVSKSEDFETIKKTIDDVLSKSTLSDKDKLNITNNLSKSASVNEQINKILSSLLMRSTFLNEFRNLGEHYACEKLLAEKCFELFFTFLDYDASVIFFNNSDESAKKVLYLDLKNINVPADVLDNLKQEFFFKMPNLKPYNTNDFICEIIKNSSGTRVENNIDSFKTSYILPFVSNGKLLGGVAFYSNEQIDYKSVEFYDDFEKEFKALLKMKFLYAEAEYLSLTDSLTGLYNRRYFEYNLEREFLRAKRYKNNLSIAMLDIDFFKNVNDTYGHQYGDFVLKETAELLKKMFRKTDMLYRYGGEEIVIILPETSLENAFIPLERLREKISQHEFVYEGISSHVTISCGISSMKDVFSDKKQIVEFADKALYNAKNAGRNRVIMYHE